MRSDRDDHSDIQSDISKPIRVRRIEMLCGPERRRRWADETKIAIVAEALEPGIVMSEVARRHDISPSQLFGWMKQFRDEAKAQGAAESAAEPLAFTPAILDASVIAGPATKPLPSSPEPGSIEISFGAAMVRIRGAADPRTLSTVLKALRALA